MGFRERFGSGNGVSAVVLEFSGLFFFFFVAVAFLSSCPLAWPRYSRYKSQNRSSVCMLPNANMGCRFGYLGDGKDTLKRM